MAKGILTAGVELESQNGIKYKIYDCLGAGGQGEVYEVETEDQKYALKWYYKHTATSQQRKILENLVAKGSPDETFLWPQDLIVAEDSFGYVMPLRPKQYRSIVDLMKRTAEPSFYHLCKAAFNLTKGYLTLHRVGYSYRDISFGNVFMDPDTGDVLICDNDNVAPNGDAECGVYGTPRFMAPEIVTGKAEPSRNTDLYSLAVLLFYMFMLNHPLEGKLEAKIKCMDILAMNKLFGTDPVFIFDPQNKSNRPLRGYQDNALIFWNIYPGELKDLFMKSFTVGLSEPAKRVTEGQWLDVFANMMSGILVCKECGSENLYDACKEASGVAHTCWCCDGALSIPSKMKVGKCRVLLSQHTKLYSHHINHDFDMETAVGEVVMNPNNPKIWGIRNLTNKNWTFIRSDGLQTPVAPGRAATIAKSVSIDFGKATCEFN